MDEFATSRRMWDARIEETAARNLLARDSAVFLHQRGSTPCLNAIRKAEGIWIEDLAGRRYMDFHGNNVHHIGYGHKRLKQAIIRQMEELSFAPHDSETGAFLTAHQGSGWEDAYWTLLNSTEFVTRH